MKKNTLSALFPSAALSASGYVPGETEGIISEFQFWFCFRIKNSKSKTV